MMTNNSCEQQLSKCVIFLGPHRFDEITCKTFKIGRGATPKPEEDSDEGFVPLSGKVP